jgi:hypothetical protein
MQRGSAIQAITEPSEAPANGYWDEPLPDGRARFRARIGGLHCSLCTGTIERALGRREGVAQVALEEPVLLEALRNQTRSSCSRWLT